MGSIIIEYFLIDSHLDRKRAQLTDLSIIIQTWMKELLNSKIGITPFCTLSTSMNANHFDH